MENLNDEQLARIVNEELAKAEGNSRRLNAVKRGARLIQENEWMHWTGNSLIILSESGELYEAGDENCQCKAFAEGFPCKHRAAFRLVKRLNEVAQ